MALGGWVQNRLGSQMVPIPGVEPHGNHARAGKTRQTDHWLLM